MAIAVDNSIARVSSGAGATSVTSGTFNAVSGQVVLICVNIDDANATPVTPTVSNNGAALTWALQASNAVAEAGNVYAWTTVLAADRTGLTVTITCAAFGTTPSIKIYLLTDADTADILGATVNGTSTTNSMTSTSITPETSGVGFAVGTDWQELGIPTSSDLTVSGFTVSGKISGMSGYKQLTSGVGATANLDAGGTGTPEWRYIWLELRAAAGGAVVPPPAPRVGRQAVVRAATY